MENQSTMCWLKEKIYALISLFLTMFLSGFLQQCDRVSNQNVFSCGDLPSVETSWVLLT